MNPDNKQQHYSRRQFIGKSIFSGSAALGLSLVLSRCQSKTTSEHEEKKTAVDPCTAFSGVSEADLKTRKKLGYVNQSPRPESKCGNCNLWLPPKEGQTCGSCMLFKGPVYTTGYCTYWAPQGK
ncbi:high-potential iron-sulfur protein [Spirosoma migulaei]